MKKTVGLNANRDRWGYVFVLPAIIGLLLVFAPMFFQTAWFSVSSIDVTEGVKTEWVGFVNFKNLFTKDQWYIQTTVASVRTVLIDFVSVLIFSFFVAVMLNSKIKGRAAARVIFFLPVLLSAGIINQIENVDITRSMLAQGAQISAATLDSASRFDIKQIISTIIYYPALTNFIVASIDRLYIIIVSSGVQILVFTAALQSVSASLYEAAKVEGCSEWESFWKITLPMVSPIILVNGVYTIIDACSKPSNPIMSQVLHQTITGRYSYASAMAIVYLSIIAMIMAFIYFVVKRLVFYHE